MSITIKNEKVERLVRDITAITGETKTEAIRQALDDRKRKLLLQGRVSNRRLLISEFLEREIWENIPRELLGSVISREEQDEILGYREDGA